MSLIGAQLVVRGTVFARFSPDQKQQLVEALQDTEYENVFRTEKMCNHYLKKIKFDYLYGLVTRWVEGSTAKQFMRRFKTKQ